MKNVLKPHSLDCTFSMKEKEEQLWVLKEKVNFLVKQPGCVYKSSQVIWILIVQHEMFT